MLRRLGMRALRAVQIDPLPRGPQTSTWENNRFPLFPEFKIYL
jgi:hypothetical protein